MDAITITLAIVAVVAMAVATVAIVAVLRRDGTPDTVAAVDAVAAALERRAAVDDERVGRIDAGIDRIKEAIAAGDGAVDEQLKRIGADLAAVTGLFRHDGARGGWGELSLERIFETAGMTAGRDYTMQYRADDGVPDAVLHLPKGRTIVVDSKFPQARFTEALAIDDPDERSAKLAEHAKEVERTAKDLVKKGYDGYATAEYVVMFVPSQAVFEAATTARESLLTDLLAVGVILTGPSGLFAIVKSTASLLSQQAAVDDAKHILDEVGVLRKRLVTFVEHLDGVRTGLAKAIGAFNGAVGSWNGRLVPHIDGMAQLAHLDGVDRPEFVTEVLRTDELREPDAA